MEAVKKRIEWVDTGKFICIMFVMLSHLQSGSEALEKFYTPFFLSAFFFLSGYLYQEPKSFRELLVKKGRALMVPWFFLSVGSILLSLLTPGVGLREIGQRLILCFLQIRGLGDEMWFVAALFVAFLPFYFVIRMHKPLGACALAVGLSLGSLVYAKWMPDFPWETNCLPWHLEYVFHAMLWMVLGYYFKLYGEKIFDRYNTRWNRVALWGIYLAAIYWNFGDGTASKDYLTSLLGIGAILSLCKVLPSNFYIRYVGANTLVYFALHGRVYAVIELVLGALFANFYHACLGNPFTSSLLAVAITVAVSLILMVPAEIINRWFPWILGRKRVK